VGAIGSFFGGIGKLGQSVLYILAGKSNRLGEVWAAHPDAIAGSYQDVISQKRDNVLRIKDAVAGIQALHDQKTLKMSDLVTEQEEDKEVQSAIIGELQDYTSVKLADGLSQADIETDIKYIELMSHYSDISDTVEQRQQRIDELDGDVETAGKDIDNYIAEIKSLNRDLENLKREADQAQADVVLAKEEQALSDLKSGLASRDQGTEELKNLRSRVQKIKSGATVSKKVAGTEDSHERRRLLEKHRQSRKSKELSQLLFQAEKTDGGKASPVASQEKTSLPE
jgi:hypothetical protein